MRVTSNMIDEVSFCRSVRSDPDLVFVEGRRYGKHFYVSLSAALEDVPWGESLEVRGETWRVHIKRGPRALVAVPITLEPRKRRRA